MAKPFWRGREYICGQLLVGSIKSSGRARGLWSWRALNPRFGRVHVALGFAGSESEAREQVEKRFGNFLELASLGPAEARR